MPDPMGIAGPATDFNLWAVWTFDALTTHLFRQAFDVRRAQRVEFEVAPPTCLAISLDRRWNRIEFLPINCWDNT